MCILERGRKKEREGLNSGFKPHLPKRKNTHSFLLALPFPFSSGDDCSLSPGSSSVLSPHGSSVPYLSLAALAFSRPFFFLVFLLSSGDE